MPDYINHCSGHGSGVFARVKPSYRTLNLINFYSREIGPIKVILLGSASNSKREAEMKQISYLLIIFVSVFALMVASADARDGRGGRGHGGGHSGYHGGGHGRIYYGGGYGGGYYGGGGSYQTYQNGNQTCVWNGYKWRCYLSPVLYGD